MKKDTSAGGAAGKVIIFLLVVNIILVIRLSYMVGKLAPSNLRRPGVEAKQSAGRLNDESRTPMQSKVRMPSEGEAISPAEVLQPLKVEILNGCGASGLAAKAADYLRSKGYDVRDVGNAKHKMYARTVIYVRTQDKAGGEALAESIGISREQVQIEPDPVLVDIDFTLILGHDYSKLKLSN